MGGVHPSRTGGPELMAATLTDARRLLDSITRRGVAPPQQLVELVEAYDAIADVSGTTSAVDVLVKNVLDNGLRGKALEKAVADAAAVQAAVTFRQGLAQRVETAVVHKFVRELERGAADEVIDSLRPEFDAAATTLAGAAELIDPNVEAVSFLEQANNAERAAWAAIPPNIKAVEKIAAVVTQFGSKSLTFPLIQLPVQVGPTAWVNDFALLCVDSKYDIQQSSVAFSRPGTGRTSPWFLAASTLKLNHLDEARESVRRWAEASWNSLGLNQGRGELDPTKGFVAKPLANPYAKEKVST